MPSRGGLGVVACELGVLIISIDIFLKDGCCLAFVAILRLICKNYRDLLCN